MGDERTTWHGIPRDQVPWQPSVDAEACINGLVLANETKL